MSEKRVARVSQEYKRTLIDVVRNHLKHENTSEMLTIMDVKLTKDFRYADVFVSIMDTDEKIQSTLDVLESHKGSIRSEMGRKIKMHYTPALRFHLDTSAEYAIHISKLLEEMK